jgi:hypothetical protein
MYHRNYSNRIKLYQDAYEKAVVKNPLHGRNEILRIFKDHEEQSLFEKYKKMFGE